MTVYTSDGAEFTQTLFGFLYFDTECDILPPVSDLATYIIKQTNTIKGAELAYWSDISVRSDIQHLDWSAHFSLQQ